MTVDSITTRIEKFYQEIFLKRIGFFKEISLKQKPNTMFISCCDSRVSPELITCSDFGDIFVVRNIGNLVPIYREQVECSTSAAIEYAISVLKIKSIIICGHTDCGAMRAALDPLVMEGLPKSRKWLSNVKGKDKHYGYISLSNYTKENIIEQLSNLRTHPIVDASMLKSNLSIYGWFYNIEIGRIEEYNPYNGSFEYIVPN